MPKTTPKPKTKTKQPNNWTKAFTWCKTHPVLTTVIVIVVGLFGYAAVSYTVYQLQINKERKQFTQLQTDMTSFYDKLTQQIGQPYAHKVIPSCDYTSAKFNKGSLSCAVDINFVYPTDDETATSIATRIADYVKTQPEISEYRVSDWGDSGDGYNTIFGDSFKLNDSKFACGMSYWETDASHGEKLPYYLPEVESPRVALRIGFNCMGSALAEYFPVVDF